MQRDSFLYALLFVVMVLGYQNCDSAPTLNGNGDGYEGIIDDDQTITIPGEVQLDPGTGDPQTLSVFYGDGGKCTPGTNFNAFEGLYLGTIDGDENRPAFGLRSSDPNQTRLDVYEMDTLSRVPTRQDSEVSNQNIQIRSIEVVSDGQVLLSYSQGDVLYEESYSCIRR